MQLASKMRFIGAQFDALLSGDLWRVTAAHANSMAQRLAAGVDDIDGVRIAQRVEANAVFAVLDPQATTYLQKRWRFYVWDESTGEVRWMCSWDTTPEDVDAFVADVGEAVTA
jgi:threonine aldolase